LYSVYGLPGGDEPAFAKTKVAALSTYKEFQKFVRIACKDLPASCYQDILDIALEHNTRQRFLKALIAGRACSGRMHGVPVPCARGDDVKKVDCDHHAPKAEVMKTVKQIVNETGWMSVNKHVLVEMLYGMETFIFPRCQDKLVSNNCHSNNLFMEHSAIKALLLLPDDAGYTKSVLNSLSQSSEESE
jgi:hypothetical protein